MAGCAVVLPIADEDCEALFIISNVFAIIIIADLTERQDSDDMVVSPDMLDVGFGIAFFTGLAGFELFYACCNSDTVTSNKGNTHKVT